MQSKDEKEYLKSEIACLIKDMTVSQLLWLLDFIFSYRGICGEEQGNGYK